MIWFIKRFCFCFVLLACFGQAWGNVYPYQTGEDVLVGEEDNAQIMPIHQNHHHHPHHHQPPSLPVPVPIPVPVPDPYCGYGGSSLCQTYNGNYCRSFARNFQSHWFSSCSSFGSPLIYFSFCTNFPTFPVFQTFCSVRGTPCLCTFTQFFHGYGYQTVYEPGFIL